MFDAVKMAAVATINIIGKIVDAGSKFINGKMKLPFMYVFDITYLCLSGFNHKSELLCGRNLPKRTVALPISYPFRLLAS